jgi:hypothetical protein
MIMERADTKALSWSPSDRKSAITINLGSSGFTR